MFTIVVPVRFFFFQRRYPQELVDSRVRVVYLQLLRVVVLVLDIDIAALLVVVVFIFEVVSALQLEPHNRGAWQGHKLFLSRILHEIIVVGHGVARVKVVRGGALLGVAARGRSCS
jgi:hypothetical protein